MLMINNLSIDLRESREKFEKQINPTVKIIK